MVITPAGESQWRIDAQVGAGIVPDSEPARQYHETLNKAHRWSRCSHNPVTRMR